jgi:hypothetical protein
MVSREGMAAHNDNRWNECMDIMRKQLILHEEEIAIVNFRKKTLCHHLIYSSTLFVNSLVRVGLSVVTQMLFFCLILFGWNVMQGGLIKHQAYIQMNKIGSWEELATTITFVLLPMSTQNKNHDKTCPWNVLNTHPSYVLIIFSI